MMLNLVIISTFITLLLIFYSLLSVVYKNKWLVSSRLDRISKESLKDKDNELNQPLFVRIIRPLLDDLSKTVLKATPKELVSVLEKKVITAGKPYNLSVKDWINIQVMILLCIPAGTIVIGYYKDMKASNILLTILIEIGVGIILPNFLLSKKVTGRQLLIKRALPDVLDLLTVSVEAGLAFDGALSKVVDKMPGPLADEFGTVLQEIKVGKQKRDALRDMAERVGLQDVTSFIGSIIQADQLGVSIGHVLRLQSEQMRQKRRMEAQEKAMKAPVKMLIPMVLFIFPTIFSVLIGPIAIKIIKVFMS